MYKRLIILAVTFAFMFSVLYMRIYVIVRNDDYIETGKNQGVYKLTVGNTNGNISVSYTHLTLPTILRV